MISLAQPTQTALETYTVCISRVQEVQLRARLAAITQLVVTASAQFAHAAEDNELHNIAQQTVLGGMVTREEMERVYKYRMARKGAPGRDVYDALLSSAPQGKCPLCVQRLVSTLDHHLPKAHYPALAVAPLNLIPACGDCNKAKLAFTPTNPNDAALHPYFDNIDDDRWLYAEVREQKPTAMRFFVEAPQHWEVALASRVRHHFTVLGLGQLYAAEAADELLNIRHQLLSLHDAGGSELVRAELKDRAESCAAARRNGWRTATFEAFAMSDWFCDGGFA